MSQHIELQEEEEQEEELPVPAGEIDLDEATEMVLHPMLTTKGLMSMLAVCLGVYLGACALLSLIIWNWLLLLFAFLCLVPAFLWLYFFYWRNNRDCAPLELVLRMCTIGVIGYIPITFIQLVAIFFLIILETILYNVFWRIGEQAVRIILTALFLLIEAFIIRAGLEKLFVYAVMNYVSKLEGFSSHYAATTFALACGLGLGTVTISLRVIFAVVDTQAILSWKDKFLYPLIIYGQNALFTLTMHAVTAMWLGIGTARRVYVNRSSEEGGGKYPEWKIIVPAVIVHGVYELLIFSIPFYTNFGNYPSYGEVVGIADVNAYTLGTNVAASVLVVALGAVTWFQLRKSMQSPGYFTSFEDEI